MAFAFDVPSHVLPPLMLCSSAELPYVVEVSIAVHLATVFVLADKFVLMGFSLTEMFVRLEGWFGWKHNKVEFFLLCCLRKK